ncbi:MAG: chromosome partitioning protein ParB, partial [Actinomycetota bacterium]|nr:chromosome partitioning protein ParB [Actinomycetota bacterium]
MVDYMNLDEQVNADFGRARRKALLRRLSACLRRCPVPERLPCFEEVRRKLGAVGGVRLGRMALRSADIVGSVGQCSEFDGAFLPTRGRARWQRVDRVFRRGEELPPVSLYK